MEDYRILFLEDRYSDRTWYFLRSWLPQRIKNVVTCTTAHEAMAQLDRSRFTHVFLDHDLDWINTWPDAMTGMDVVAYIERACPSVKKFIVHSTSAQGGIMNERLTKAGYNSIWLPFETHLIRMSHSQVLPFTNESVPLNT